MENPFENLRRKRLAREERERPAREAREALEKEKWQKEGTAYERYDDLVTDVLEQLRQAVYPAFRLERSSKEPGLGFAGWSITGPIDGEEYDEDILYVALRFDSQSSPIGFSCSVGRSGLRWGSTQDLSRKELISLLQELHTTS